MRYFTKTDEVFDIKTLPPIKIELVGFVSYIFKSDKRAFLRLVCDDGIHEHGHPFSIHYDYDKYVAEYDHSIDLGDMLAVKADIRTNNQDEINFHEKKTVIFKKGDDGKYEFYNPKP